MMRLVAGATPRFVARAASGAGLASEPSDRGTNVPCVGLALAASAAFWVGLAAVVLLALR